MKNESIYASGKLFELVHLTQPDGRVFEVARRAPGVRVIIADKDKKKLLLTREVRRELTTPDYRLPGGKVFDSLAEFETFRASGKNIADAAAAKAKAEAQEEAGIAVKGVELFKRSVVGATVEWDLYVFEATQWYLHEEGQSLEEGEQIEDVGWYDFTEVEQMILEGAMQEERIALITLQWLRSWSSSLSP
jgi:ADP-ribose pyrophosphatase YjhB (NUDIX family)